MNTPLSAKELFLSYLENIDNPDKVIELFDDDAVIELPYLHSLGLPWRWQGKKILFDFLKSIPDVFTGFKFQNVRMHIDTADQAFGEYDVDFLVASTRLPYRQTYMGRLVAENGRIKLIREALDTVVVEKSMFRDIDGSQGGSNKIIKSDL